MDAGVKTKKPGTPLERARKGESSAQVAIKSVGIIGAGQMGNGIAHVVALAGYEVALYDVKKETIDKARCHHRAQHGAPGVARHHHAMRICRRP